MSTAALFLAAIATLPAFVVSCWVWLAMASANEDLLADSESSQLKLGA